MVDLRVREYVASPKFTYHEKVALTCDKTFYSFSATGRSRKTLCAGTVVEVSKPEPLYDDHGRFDRYWYHLKHELWWEAIAEERDLAPAGVLDRLALIAPKRRKQQVEDGPPPSWSYRKLRDEDE